MAWGKYSRSFSVGIITEYLKDWANFLAEACASKKSFVLGAWIWFAEIRPFSFSRSSAVSTSNHESKISTVRPETLSFAIVSSQVEAALHEISDRRSGGHVRRPSR